MYFVVYQWFTLFGLFRSVVLSASFVREYLVISLVSSVVRYWFILLVIYVLVSLVVPLVLSLGMSFFRSRIM